MQATIEETRPGRTASAVCMRHQCYKRANGPRDVYCPECRAERREARLAKPPSPRPDVYVEPVVRREPDPRPPIGYGTITDTHVGAAGTHWLVPDPDTPGAGLILYRLHGGSYVYVDRYPTPGLHALDLAANATVEKIWRRVKAYRYRNQ